jgi:hypothetical protein
LTVFYPGTPATRTLRVAARHKEPWMAKHPLIELVASKPIPPVASPVEITLVFNEPRGLEGSPSPLFRSTLLDVGAPQHSPPGADFERSDEPTVEQESKHPGGAS